MDDCFKLCFDQSVSNIKRQVIKKLKDSNTLKSNFNTPHHRKITLDNIPPLPFAWLFGKNFSLNETTADNKPSSSSLFSILTVGRLLTVVPTEAILKVHSTGDTPWLKLNCNFSVIFGGS